MTYIPMWGVPLAVKTSRRAGSGPEVGDGRQGGKGKGDTRASFMLSHMTSGQGLLQPLKVQLCVSGADEILTFTQDILSYPVNTVASGSSESQSQRQS